MGSELEALLRDLERLLIQAAMSAAEIEWQLAELAQRNGGPDYLASPPDTDGATKPAEPPEAPGGRHPPSA